MAQAKKKSAAKKASRKKTASKRRAVQKKRAKTAPGPDTKNTAVEAESPREKPKAMTLGEFPTSLADLESAFDRIFHRRFGQPFHWPHPSWSNLSEMMEARVPSIDVVDHAGEVVVRAEVPGVDREDLDVEVADRTLTIKGSSRHEETEEKDDFFRREIRSGEFSRSVLLPADVNATKAKASFKDGVVELHLPKLRKSKSQKISV